MVTTHSTLRNTQLSTLAGDTKLSDCAAEIAVRLQDAVGVLYGGRDGKTSCGVKSWKTYTKSAKLPRASSNYLSIAHSTFVIEIATLLQD